MNSRAFRRVAGAGSIATFWLSVALNANAQQQPPPTPPAAQPPAAQPPAAQPPAAQPPAAQPAVAQPPAAGVQPPPAAAPPPPAAAQPLPPAEQPPASGYLPIVIKGETNDLVMDLKLLSMEGNPGYVDRSGGVRCTGSCRLEVPAGKYRLAVIGPDGKRTERTITIRQSEKFWVSPPSESARTTGLVLGVVGSVMVPVGIVMMVQGLDDSFDGGDSDRTAGYGLLMFLAGAAIAPVGWVMFGRSGRFSLERQPIEAAAAEPPRLNFGVAVLPSGGAIGGSFNF